MKSAVVRRFGGPEVVELQDLSRPEPRANCVRVQVLASCVNPIDLSTRAGRLTDAGLMAPQAVVGLGWDLCGVVDAIGAGVSRARVGQRVIGLRDLLFDGGAHAEHVVVHESAIAPAPSSLSDEQAATLPLNALSADRALDLTGLRRGDTLLITGAAGAVGGFAVELAAARGIQVIAQARPARAAAVRAAGAREVITAGGAVGAVVREMVPGGVDAVIDAATLGIAAHEALRGEGVFVALVAPFAPPPIRATRVFVQEVFADGARLAELSAMADAGLLTPRVALTLPLAAAARGHQLAEQGGLNGKVVLKP